MMDEKVSIIIPIYNGEKYVIKCLDSIINGKYKNIEIIAIDDGSTDHTLKLLNEYSKKHKDIVKVFSQKNSGQSAARNKGLTKATGEYVAFVDCDDYVTENYISDMKEKIERYDYVLSGYSRVNYDDKVIYSKVPKNNVWSKFKYVSTCSKLYKLKFLLDNDIKFPNKRIGEDIYFNMLCLSKSSNVGVVCVSNYRCLANDESVTHTKKKEDSNNVINLLKQMNEKLKFENSDIKYVKYFYLKSIVLDLITVKSILNEQEFVEKFDKDFKWFEKVNKEKFNCKLRLNYNIYEEFYVNIAVNLFVFCYKTKNIKLLYWFLNKILKGGIK